MAQISIREKDLTGAAAPTTFDVAVVAGLTVNNLNELNPDGTRKYIYDYGKPYYFNTLSKFQNAMGEKPVKLTGDGIAYTTDANGNITCPATETTTKAFFKAGDGVVDCGYVFASELLLAGLPIYYIPVAGTTAQAVYNALEGTTESLSDAVASAQAAVVSDGVATITTTITTTAETVTDAIVDGFVGVKKFVSDSESIGEFTVQNNKFSAVATKSNATTVALVVTFDADAILVPTDTTLDVLYANKLGDSAVTITVYYRDGETEEADSVLLQLADRGTFNVKYITSGGYPTFEYNNNKIANTMLKVAGAKGEDHETDDYKDNPATNSNGRGDAVALIDHFEQDTRKLSGEGSVFYRLNTLTGEAALSDTYLSFGAMFTPYANYNLQGSYEYVGTDGKNHYVTQMHLPASFAYLTCLARQLKATLPTYEATAGVGRGSVINVAFNNKMNAYEMCTRDVLTNYIANMYNAPMTSDAPSTSGFDAQISINGITQVNPYGMVIYGTRTLAKKDPVLGVKATGILNIRNMVSDIKKQMYQIARKYMFSANTEALWLGFKTDVSPVLDAMTGTGISGYTLEKDKEKSTKDALFIKCSIKPIYPVERFDITIEITDDDVEVNEA